MHFRRVLLIFLDVDSGQIVVCAGVFLLAVGEKIDLSKNIAMCGNMCQ